LISFDTKFRPCCCAHTHKEDCWWDYLRKKNKEEAHDIHLGNCCDIKSNVHNSFCPNYKKFIQKRKEIKQEMKKSVKKKEKAQVPTGTYNNLFFNQIDDDDDYILGDDYDSDEADSNVLCCCKPHLIHNESMKYQLLYSEEVDIDQS